MSKRRQPKGPTTNPPYTDAYTNYYTSHKNKYKRLKCDRCKRVFERKSGMRLMCPHCITGWLV
jgi:hypothetical protein